MIVNERVVAYINSLDCGNSDICNTIEKKRLRMKSQSLERDG